MRFRFRTLLVVFTVLSIWIGSVTNQARRQKRSIAAITAAGGKVRYGDEGDRWIRRYGRANLTPDNREESGGTAWLRSVLGDEYFPNVAGVTYFARLNADAIAASIGNLRTVEILYVGDTDLSDDGVHSLRDLKGMKWIDVISTEISDESLKVFARWKQLEVLELSNATNVTDAGMAHLRGMKNLRVLALGDLEIDDGVKYLRELPQLESLALEYGHLTDVGLGHLTDHPSLTYIDVRGTFVTEEAVAAFVKANPTCELRHDFE